MDDAQYEAQRARLLRLSNEWVRAVGLGQWRLELVYDRSGTDFASSVERHGGFSQQTVARAFPDWRYQIATIVWNMPEVAEVDDERLEGLFVHELMHIFLHEMRVEEAEAIQLPHEERVATMLQRAFIWIRDRARDGEWGKADA